MKMVYFSGVWKSTGHRIAVLDLKTLLTEWLKPEKWNSTGPMNRSFSSFPTLEIMIDFRWDESST